MAEQTVLGQFLLSRRTRLRPQDIGLVSYGTRRRVTGLRREELAQLAGVSASYYTRLEQGQVTSASTEVLDATMSCSQSWTARLRVLPTMRSRAPSASGDLGRSSLPAPCRPGR